MQDCYPHLILIVDCALVIANILAVLVTVLYVTKLELYAGLPQDIPATLPSYDLKVSFQINQTDVIFIPGYPTLQVQL